MFELNCTLQIYHGSNVVYMLINFYLTQNVEKIHDRPRCGLAHGAAGSITSACIYIYMRIGAQAHPG